jgi:hypothetical protein
MPSWGDDAGDVRPRTGRILGHRVGLTVLVALLTAFTPGTAAQCPESLAGCSSYATTLPEKSAACLRAKPPLDTPAGCCYYCSSGLCSKEEAFADPLGSALAVDDIDAYKQVWCKGAAEPSGGRTFQEWYPNTAAGEGANAGTGESWGACACDQRCSGTAAVCGSCCVAFEGHGSINAGINREAIVRQQPTCVQCAQKEKGGGESGTAGGRNYTAAGGNGTAGGGKDTAGGGNATAAGGDGTANRGSGSGSGCVGVSTVMDAVPWLALASMRGYTMMEHPLSGEMRRSVLCWEVDADNKLCATPGHIVVSDAGHETMASVCERVVCTESIEVVGNFWHPNREEEMCGSKFCVTQKVDNSMHRMLDIIKGQEAPGVAVMMLWKVLRMLNL